MFIEGFTVLVLFNFCVSSRLPLEVFQRYPSEHHHHNHKNYLSNGNLHRKKLQEYNAMKVLYQVGRNCRVYYDLNEATGEDGA
ncbi:hypothetical protein HUJ04_012205 [Dendroctonus ponderosae]|nr:hypothetical protein HUJ04_012205 [Dendroctonus ponderosae]KAH1029372.1 hypothetical protein HUJ05_002628 [Dendroctonus ponderosae]